MLCLHPHHNSILQSLLSGTLKNPLCTTIGYMAIFNYLASVLTVSLYLYRYVVRNELHLHALSRFEFQLLVNIYNLVGGFRLSIRTM